jgi:hypothetical protein
VVNRGRLKLAMSSRSNRFNNIFRSVSTVSVVVFVCCLDEK